MPITRLVLTGLSSLISAWALSNALGGYLQLMVQTFNPLSTPVTDGSPAILWFAAALSTGLFAFALVRSTYKERQRIAKTTSAPAPVASNPGLFQQV